MSSLHIKFSRRQLRALAILAQGGQLAKVSDTQFKVKSQTSNKIYSVVWVAGRWSCSCPDFTKRLKDCKHVYAVQYYASNVNQVRANGYRAAANSKLTL